MHFYYKYKPEILEVLKNNNPKEVRELFAIFDKTSDEEVYKACYLWIHWYFPQFFKRKECEEQIQIIKNNCDWELGKYKTLTEVGFRGLGKTTTSKLVIAFFLANNYRTDKGKFYKVVSADEGNSRQVVTDLYNILIEPKILYIYSILWTKSNLKRVEKQTEFDLATGVKVKASTVEKRQRGNVQMESRPDRVWFEDIEDATTISSMVETAKIRKTIDEAYQGMSVNGRALYNVNYISKRGNVHRVVVRAKNDPQRHHLHLVPIIKEGVPTWFHSLQEIEDIKNDAEDWDGDYLCDPKNPYDSYFNEQIINMHPTREPLAKTKKWLYYALCDNSHSYSIGVDPSGGNGGDLATIMVIDLTVGELVAEFADKFTNEATLAEEVNEKGLLYGNALVVVERNNHGHAVLMRLNQLNYPNLYEEVDNTKYDQKETLKLGFNTTRQSKPLILGDLSKGINTFALRVPSAILKNELRNFPREYVDAQRPDPELGHYDRVMALALAWFGRLYVANKTKRLIIS